jgi:hypothetical protein
MKETREPARPNFDGSGRRSGGSRVEAGRNYRFLDCRAGGAHYPHPTLNGYMSGL